ncbi:MAG: glycine/sarcosine/betaine reductase selenoprotein B family protein [Pseudomonadota bacterium]
MVKLSDLSKYDRDHVLMKQLPPLEPFAWVDPTKPVSEMTFAVITTAGLHFRGEPNFELSDASYRAIPGDQDTADLIMSHVSTNFDKSGFRDDVNVVFPLDRFRELAGDGTIGGLASVHYSFMGGGLLPDAYETSVRSLAGHLKRDGVDAVFITPVCPNCTRATCAIAHYLESEGIVTTGIALIRENAEALQPPRLLWVTFPLGYPLGKPNDPPFQRQVIEASLDLLNRPSGPVLEDYGIDLPDTDLETADFCPVNFSQPTGDTSTWRSRLANERLLLQPWYDMSLRRRRRTMVGIADADIDEILDMVGGWLDDRSQPFPDGKAFKYGIEDAKAWYSEAISGQPGDYGPGQVDHVLYHETAFGAALKEYFNHFAADEKTIIMARLIAPRWAMEASTGTGAVDKHGKLVEQPGAKALREGGHDD